jgi:hypothetical protein
MSQLGVTFLAKPNFSAGDVTSKFIKDVTQLWKESVAIFVETILEHIVIDTGMSAATLQPLGIRVGMKNILAETMRGRGPKRGHRGLIGQWADNNAKFKSAALGARLGQRAYDLKFGTPSNPVFEFEFHIVVFQYFLHESGMNYSGSGDWQSLEAGREAFQNHFDSNIESVVGGIIKMIFE